MNSESPPLDDSVQFIYTVNVTKPLTNGHTVVNSTYEISATNPALGISSGPPVTTTVLAPSWNITKTVSPAIVQPGQYLLYTITLTNEGKARLNRRCDGDLTARRQGRQNGRDRRADVRTQHVRKNLSDRQHPRTHERHDQRRRDRAALYRRRQDNPQQHAACVIPE